MDVCVTVAHMLDNFHANWSSGVLSIKSIFECNILGVTIDVQFIFFAQAKMLNHFASKNLGTI